MSDKRSLEEINSEAKPLITIKQDGLGGKFTRPTSIF